MSSPGPKSYDAFLSYNSQDRPAVRELAEQLKREDLVLYLDESELAPGREFQPVLAEALRDSMTCVVLLGPNGLGPWQKEELGVAINTRARDEAFHVIPVLLPGAERPRRGDVAHLEFLFNARWVEFLTTLDDERALSNLVWGITGTKPRAPDATRYEGVCPYRGLEAFRPEDAKFFFGRTSPTGWLVSALRREIRAAQGVRFLGVLGPSGSGKSSLVLAGLVPSLNQPGAIEGSERWQVAILRPGDDPLKNLAAAVVSRFLPPGALPDIDQARGLIADLRTDGQALDLFAQMALHNQPEDMRLVVVVDQFEEVYTYRPQDGPARARFEQDRGQFFANLLNAAAAPGGRVAVVLTMRSDFLGACAAFPQLAAVLSAHQEQVGPMIAAELREAIERPAYLVGCEVEPGLTERLLADVARQPGALPLVQFALTEVWRRRDVRRLNLRAYEELGGVAGALEHRADEIYGKLNLEDQNLCQRLFLRLVQPGEGTEDTKRRVSYCELLPADPARAAAVRNLVQALAARDARLLTTEGTDAADGAVEVAHEALIRGWPQLRQWVDAERAGLRIQRRLTESAQEWAAARPEHKHDYLYAGARLAVCREWVERHSDELSKLEAAFVAASEAAEAETEDRKRRELEAAQRRADEAQHALARQLALHAEVILEKNPQRSILLAVEALRLSQSIGQPCTPGSEPEALLRKTLANCGGQALVGYPPTDAVAFSPNNQRLATGHDDGTLRIWDLTAKQPTMAPIVLCEPHNQLIILSIHKYDHNVVYASVDGVLQRWDLTGKGTAPPCKNLGLLDGAIALSANHRWLGCVGRDNTLRRWDLEATDPVADTFVLEGQTADISTLAISPDGRWLAGGSPEGFARLWALKTQTLAPAMILRHHRWAIRTLAFSPDHHWLVTGSSDGTARLWDMTARNRAAAFTVLLGQGHEVDAVAFSPNGHRLITGSSDGTVQLWDLTARRPASVARIFRGRLLALGNRWLATAMDETIVLLWDLAGQKDPLWPFRLRGAEEQISPVAISPDEHWLVIGARLWDLTIPNTVALPIVLPGSCRYRNVLAVSPHGPWLATGEEYLLTSHAAPAGPAAIEPSARTKYGLLQHIAQKVLQLRIRALSRRYEKMGAITLLGPPGAALMPRRPSEQEAALRAPGATTLWDWTAQYPGATSTVLRGHQALICAAAISPNNHWLATGSEDTTARLWDLTAKDPAEAPRVLRGHTRAVDTVAFSPDGRWLATGSYYVGDVRLWHITSPDPTASPVSLRGPTHSYYSLAFSPNSHWLILVAHNCAQLWDLTTPDPSMRPILLESPVSGTGGAAVSSDSHWLVTAGANNTALLWDLAMIDGAAPVVLRGHQQEVTAVAVSPDKNWLATGSRDCTARLWDLAAEDLAANPRVLRGHEEAVIAVTFSPDGHWLATGSGSITTGLSISAGVSYVLSPFESSPDAEIRLWDLRDRDPGAKPISLRGHSASITALAFTPDNGWLISASRDNTVRLWKVTLDDLMNVAQRTVGRNLTREEWERYFPGQEYRKTFPDLPLHAPRQTDPISP